MAGTVVIERLGSDVLSIMQCIAIDADVFPYPSADFTARSWRDRIWIARAWVARASGGEGGEGGETSEGRPRVLAFLASRVRQGVLYVPGLAVDPPVRQRGIGRALLRACIRSDLASMTGAVVLSVSVENRRAIALYASEGFVITGRIADHYPRGVYAQRDAYIMQRAPGDGA
jgi:ribosomal protein S18 acetylase RimI-like enzyme